MRRVSPRGLLIVLWFLAFSHRLFLLLGNIDRSWPFSIFYEGDAETFYNYAQAILAGTPYDSGIPFHPPLFPFLLSLGHGLFGGEPNHLALRIAMAAVYSLQPPLLYAFLRRYLSGGASLAAALLCVYSFGLSVLSISALSEGLYLLLLLVALILFRRTREHPLGEASSKGKTPGSARGEALRGAGLGVTLGLLSLTRAEGLLLGLVLLVWGGVSAWRARPTARAVRPWVWGAVGLLLVLAPWTIRNAVTISRVNRTLVGPGLSPIPVFVPTTAYGPLNFALANHENAPGYFTRDLLTSGLQKGVLDLHDPQHNLYFVHGLREGTDFIVAHPGEFLSLVGRKLGLLGRTLHLGWTQWDLPGGLTGARYPVDLFAPVSPAAVFVHLLLLLPGIWLLWRAPRGWARFPGEDGPDPRGYLRLCAILTGLCLLMTAALFGYVRQGALLLPFLFGVEGVALSRGARLLATRLPRAVVAVIILLWVIELAGAFQNRNYIASGDTVAGSKMLNRDSIMRISPAGRTHAP